MFKLPTWNRLPRSERIVIWVSFLAVLGIEAFFSFWANNDRIVTVLKMLGLPVLLVCVGLVFQGTLRQLRSSSDRLPLGPLLAESVSRNRAIVIIWLCCVAATWMIFPKGNRILMDEIIVLSTSKAIHEEREPVTPTFLHLYNGVHKLTAAFIDKRPYLYAMIVASFHDAFHYRPENAFYANMVLAAATLGLVGFVGSKLGHDWRAGSVAMIALTSVPLFCEHATGGGIDITNLFAMSLLLGSILVFREKPTVWSAQIMMGAGIFLAYARYESLIFLVLPFFALFGQWRRTGRLHLHWSSLLFWPAFLPLFGIHYITFSRSADAFQLADAKVTAAFSLNFFPDNVGHALAFFLNTEHLLTNSAVVFIVGLIALTLLLVSSTRNLLLRNFAKVDIDFVAFAAVNLFGFALLMAYSWGKLDEVVASRLSLPLYLLFAISAGIFPRQIRNRTTAFWVLGIVFVGSLYWSAFPLAAKHYGFKVYTGAQRQALMDEFNQRQPDRRFAVLNNITNYWLTRDVYAVSPSSVNANPTFLANMLRSGDFRRVYLIQSLQTDPKTGNYTVNNSDALTLPVDTEIESEDLVTGDQKLRISKIKPSSIALLEAAAVKR